MIPLNGTLLFRYDELYDVQLTKYCTMPVLQPGTTESLQGFV